MLEMNAEFGEVVEGPVEWSSDLLPEMNDMTYEPGSFLERAMDFADAEAIQTFFVELVDNLQESFGEALDAYLDKVAENAVERQAEIERPLQGEEAVYTESEVREMVEEAIEAYERGYRAGQKEDVDEAVSKAGAMEEKSVERMASGKVAIEEPEPEFEPKARGEDMPVEEAVEEVAELGTYTVVSGDCLWKIAQREYGDASKWPAIYEANREIIGGNPDLIHPGQEFVIPPLEGVETPATIVSSEPPVYVSIEPVSAEAAKPAVETVILAEAPEAQAQPTPEPPAAETAADSPEPEPEPQAEAVEVAEAPPPAEETIIETVEASPPAEVAVEEPTEPPQEADAVSDVGVETLTVEETMAPIQEMVEGLESSEVNTAYFLTDEPMGGDRVAERVSGSITVDSSGQVVSTSSRTEYSDGTADVSGSIFVPSRPVDTSGAEQPPDTGGLEQPELERRIIMTMQGPRIIEVQEIPPNAIPSNAIPSNAIPPNAIPSNAIPSNAIPSNAIPSN